MKITVRINQYYGPDIEFSFVGDIKPNGFIDYRVEQQNTGWKVVKKNNNSTDKATQIKTGLNSQGRTSLIKWLASNDKRFHESTYNVDLAVNQVEDKLLESDRLNYELDSFNSVSGLAVVCCFNSYEFNYESEANNG